MKKERPILFSTDMVKAIMAGRKTMTRRVMKPQPISQDIEMTFEEDRPVMKYGETGKRIAPVPPYGWQGDLLWVKETWALNESWDHDSVDKPKHFYKASSLNNRKWRPSIYMPKDAARIWLKITNIDVERLQDIIHQDAVAEGIEPIGKNCEGATIFRNYENPPDYIATGELSPRLSFCSLWDSINDKPDKNWNANPWVWVVSFKVLSTTGKPNQFQQLEKEYRNGC